MCTVQYSTFFHPFHVSYLAVHACVFFHVRCFRHGDILLTHHAVCTARPPQGEGPCHLLPQPRNVRCGGGLDLHPNGSLCQEASCRSDLCSKRKKQNTESDTSTVNPPESHHHRSNMMTHLQGFKHVQLPLKTQYLSKQMEVQHLARIPPLNIK